MTQSFDKNLSLKPLYGINLPCGTCSYCKSISITGANQMVVECWHEDLVVFQIEPNKIPKCPCQEIRDLVPNFKINQ